MPQKLWTSQADWQLWTPTVVGSNDTVTVAGQLRVAAGHQETVCQSPVYQAPAWLDWAVFGLTGARGEGCSIRVRFRVGNSNANCLAAAWSPYYDDMDEATETQLLKDMGGLIDNLIAAPFIIGWTNGAWAQFELTLQKE